MKNSVAGNPLVGTSKIENLRTPKDIKYNIHSLPEREHNLTIPIPNNYHPSAQLITEAKQHECFFVDDKDELQNFICYCKSRNLRSADWDAEYFRWLLRTKHYLREKQIHIQARRNTYASTQVNKIADNRKERSETGQSKIVDFKQLKQPEAENYNHGGHFGCAEYTKRHLWEAIRPKLE